MSGAEVVDWPIRLFSKSVLKQRKFEEIVALLGPTGRCHCLDIGADNGVISYLLRRRGGSWKSADLDEPSVAAIRELVGTEVYQIDGQCTPFQDDEFDRVVVVDFLEHIPDEAGFIAEMHRILKPGGLLIVNTPHHKEGLLRRLRQALGQTDEKHGHLRPGYTLASLDRLFGERFGRESHRTYSKFFSELIDTALAFAISQLQRGKKEQSRKGTLFTGKDLHAYRAMFRIYSLLYPLVWFFSKLDGLLVFASGYMLIVKARVRKA